MSPLAWRIVIGALTLLTLGGGGALTVTIHGSFAGTPVSEAPPSSPEDPPPGLESPMDSGVPAGGLFRVSRAPAPVAFDPRGDPGAAPVVEPHPGLTLTGVILGSTRAALVRGLPGNESAQVLAEGDDVGGARLIRVDSAMAILIWRGDTVRLTLPRKRE